VGNKATFVLDEKKLIILEQGHECLCNLQHKDYDNLVKYISFLEGDSTRSGTFTKDTALSENGRVVAGGRHGMCESAFNTAGERHGICENACNVNTMPTKLSQRKLCTGSYFRCAHKNVNSRVMNPETLDASSDIRKYCIMDGVCLRKVGS
jgi:NAD(P)H-flavin reductase